MSPEEKQSAPQRPAPLTLLRELESLRARIRELELTTTGVCLASERPSRSGSFAGGANSSGHPLDFGDIFNIEAIQEIQDAFAAATNVASIITDTEGRPITRPSRFCRLCRDVVRRTPKGLANCIRSDAAFGSSEPREPIMRPCLSSGLWDGGASICVGNRQIATWVVGQVRLDTADAGRMRAYAAEIGADADLYREAFAETPVMSRDQFLNVCRALCLIASQISSLAEQNCLQAQAIELRRQAETALRESEARFRQLAEATFEGIFILEDNVIRDTNQAGQALFGYAREELCGRDIETLVAPQCRPLAGLWADGDGAAARVAVLLRADGSQRTCEVRKRGIVFQGNPARVLAIRDITERVLSEQAAREKQEQLLQADKMVSLGVLVAGMAHEINNPNSVMTLNLPLFMDIWEDIAPLLETYYRENGDFLAGGLEYSELRSLMPDLLARMYEGATRIRTIVGSLKNFSRRSSGDVKWAIDVNAVVCDSLDLVGNLVAKATNRFRVALAAKLPAVMANPQEISQVIINLVVNACQALTQRDQALSVSTFLDADKDEVGVRVVDEGVGIPAENIPKLVEPFFTTKRETGGTGLGLSVSSTIVEEHGGRLQFFSGAGGGATVELRLPIAGQGAAASSQGEGCSGPADTDGGRRA